ncbi:hypothetical protein [Niameybacter sp.]|uniref:hypothetical protein n=1 Tax=Niameybacter sp. TaxID=2033640 RepID=UPI002FCC77F0
MNILRIFEDEILYSWVSRMYTIHNLKGYALLNELLGTQKFYIHQVKPLKVEVKGMEIQNLIQNHSIMPIVRPFMTQNRYEKLVVEFMTHKNTKGLRL